MPTVYLLFVVCPCVFVQFLKEEYVKLAHQNFEMQVFEMKVCTVITSLILVTSAFKLNILLVLYHLWCGSMVE